MTEHVQTAPRAERQVDWWHRDHPTFMALAGFFSGLVFVGLVPAVFMAGLRASFDDGTAEALFPFVLVFLALPLGLLVAVRTRRFAAYMWLGILSTTIVVSGVATLVLWLLTSQQG